MGGRVSNGLTGVALACGFALAACAPEFGMGAGKPPPAMIEMIQAALVERAKLKVFDTNGDAEITAAEVEAGLERKFAGFDLNHDGVLRAFEVAQANERLAIDDAAMPALRDWNQSGAVEFDEFAAWNRGRFRRTDSDKDGIVTQAELTAPPKMPPRPPGGMPPGGMPPGGKPPGGGMPSGGMPGGRLSQTIPIVSGGAG